MKRGTSTGSLKVRRTARALVVRATGAVAERLMAALSAEMQAAKGVTVRFVDQGQDVLEWDLDPQRRVVGCRPFQDHVWLGTRVLGEPLPGRRLRVLPPLTQLATTFRYPVADVTEMH